VKSAQEQLSNYKSVHLNSHNIKTHFIGIPLIIWSIFLLLNLIPFQISVLDALSEYFPINVATLFAIGVLAYYSLLHVRLAFGLAIFILPVLYTSFLVAQQASAWWIALVVFAVGWALQLLGHHYEQAKPAFIDDLNQLFIGPFFLMAELYFLLGLEAELNKSITSLAITKRRQLEKKPGDNQQTS